MVIRSQADLCRCAGIKCVVRRERETGEETERERETDRAWRSEVRSFRRSCAPPLPPRGELLRRIYATGKCVED